MAGIAALEEKPKLARDYGFDISMHDNSMAVSTSALKVYQKKVALLYSEFIKNMNSHLREEKKERKIFLQLRKEKLLHSQYSLYRSDGADLFSKATENRSKLMENFVTMSPVALDDVHNYTPWGLDMIIDEDLIGLTSAYEEEIRPHTAPAGPNPVEEQTNEQEPEERPSTVPHLSNANNNTMKCINIIQHTHTELDNLEPTPEPKMEVQNSPWSTLKNAVKGKPAEDLPVEDLEPGIDGHVDMKLDQTKARKIMIKSKAFEQLLNGIVCAKLKEKSGEFIMKPAPVIHKPDAITAYFMAKDPNKEIMALVRKRTNLSTSTISCDMKVNNKIPIMKSLLGHKVKKTTVAEIMSEARNRKTKQYKVILKNYRQESTNQGETPKDQNNTTLQSSPITSPRNKESSDIDPVLNERNLKRQLHQDLEKHNMECIQNRIRVVMQAWQKNETPRPSYVLSTKDKKPQRLTNEHDFVIRQIPPSPISDLNPDKLSSFHPRVKFIDESQRTPLNRSASSMSFRDALNDLHRERSPTDNMGLVVEHKRPESRSESSLSFATGYGSLNRLPRRDRTPSRLFLSRRTPVSSDSYSELGIDAPSKFVSTKDATKMIQAEMKKDKEKESALLSLRRKMATASAGKFNPRTRKF